MSLTSACKTIGSNNSQHSLTYSSSQANNLCLHFQVSPPSPNLKRTCHTLDAILQSARSKRRLYLNFKTPTFNQRSHQNKVSLPSATSQHKLSSNKLPTPTQPISDVNQILPPNDYIGISFNLVVFQLMRDFFCCPCFLQNIKSIRFIPLTLDILKIIILKFEHFYL